MGQGDLGTVIKGRSEGTKPSDLESIGQSNRILLNMAVDYSPRHLAMAIKRYFELNQNALEVLIFKGSKSSLLFEKIPNLSFSSGTL